MSRRSHRKLSFLMFTSNYFVSQLLQSLARSTSSSGIAQTWVQKTNHFYLFNFKLFYINFRDFSHNFINDFHNFIHHSYLLTQFLERHKRIVDCEREFDR